MMNWEVNFYSTKVEKAIEEWPPSLHARFLKVVERIEKYGPHTIGMPHIWPLKKGLSEIRVKRC